MVFCIYCQVVTHTAVRSHGEREEMTISAAVELIVAIAILVS